MAHAVQEWVEAVGSKTAYIEPGVAMGERLLRRLRYELLKGEIFYSLREAQILIKQ